MHCSFHFIKIVLSFDPMICSSIDVIGAIVCAATPRMQNTKSGEKQLQEFLMVDRK